MGPPRKPPDVEGRPPQGPANTQSDATADDQESRGVRVADTSRAPVDLPYRVAGRQEVAPYLRSELRGLACRLAPFAEEVDSLSDISVVDLCELVRRDRETLDSIVDRTLADGSIPPWWSS
jgi:hypothetical protein